MVKYIFQPRLNLFDVVLLPFVVPLFLAVTKASNVFIAFGVSILAVAIITTASYILETRYCKEDSK